MHSFRKGFTLVDPSTALRMTRAGFTLVELLLVIGIIAILMGIMVGALSPTRQLGFARDAKRQSDVNTILNATYQYAIDHNGLLPPSIPLGLVSLEICRTDAASCVNGVDLTLVTSGAYLGSIPIDPRAPETGTGTSYFIRRDNNGRITVNAPLAEVRNLIEVTR